jgi:methylated-DNA-[protein]-cysteine S-methyltransferase
MNYRFEQSSPLGNLTLFSSDGALTGLYFEQHTPAPKPTMATLDAGPFADVIEQLEQYFAGERDEFDLATRFEGTDFQVQVWNALKDIELGQTKTYGQLALECERPKAVRAVGAAVGRNPISIVVPCHRVVGSSGQLTGFAGGLERKRWLLDREHANIKVAH